MCKKILFSSITVAFLFMFVSSCEKNTLSQEKSPFLDLNIVENSIFSESEFMILAEAYKRVDNFIVYDNGRHYLTINSAKEINISERLLHYIRETIELANKQEEFYRILSKEGIKFVKPKHLQINSFPRVRSGGEESEGGYSIYHGIGYVIESVTLNHDESIFLLNSLQSAAGDAGEFASWMSFGAGLYNVYMGGMGLILSSYAYLQTSSFSRMENQYIDSGSISGITFMTYTSYLNDGGLPVTHYYTSINE